MKKNKVNEVKPTEFIDGKPYTHRVPERYSPGSIWQKEWEKTPNDELMYKLIKDYAKEGKDKDGRPNGQFYIDKKSAK